jgi:enoyl-[acyl-carrier-protein] reductase (NADH)
MIIHYIGAKMKISEKLEQLKNDKLETAKQLKEDIKDLKITSISDMKEQKALLNIWADINNQIEEIETMIESLAIMGR